MNGNTKRKLKLPHRAISVEEKVDAIERVYKGESKAAVARDLFVPESTLRGWCKSEHKIRGMARNSSTPDSEVHSPASSSGANPLAGIAGTSNMSSEDEGLGPSGSKKAKLDYSGGCDPNELNDSEGLDSKQTKVDYMSSIINSLMAGGVRSESSSILLQQLGLLQSAQSAANLTNNILNLSNGGLPSSHLSSPQTVGLVENGLQYTKSNSSMILNQRSSSSHISAIATTTQLDSVNKSGSRKSLPPAAEAPLTPVPATPRKTSEHHNEALNLQRQLHSNSRNAYKINGVRRKPDKSTFRWLAPQYKVVGHSSLPHNPSTSEIRGSWFSQRYKQCTFPTVALQQQQASQLYRKSPTKEKAILDNVLCNNNNNENVRKSLNFSSASGNDFFMTDEYESEAAATTTEEAIEHGEKFLKCLSNGGVPSISLLQLKQLRRTLDSIKYKNQ